MSRVEKLEEHINELVFELQALESVAMVASEELANVLDILSESSGIDYEAWSAVEALVKDAYDRLTGN